MRKLPILTVAVLLVGCGDGTSSDDAGVTGMDAGAAVDAGGGGADAGDTDAGDTDAGSADCAGATVDEACSDEGAVCGGPCTDECSFCNLLRCSGGVWNRVEVFPTPCFQCGPDAQCVTAEQHCVRSFSDVGGVPDDYQCDDNPAACMADDATCACLGDELAFDDCLEPNPGEVEIQYFGG